MLCRQCCITPAGHIPKSSLPEFRRFPAPELKTAERFMGRGPAKPSENSNELTLHNFDWWLDGSMSSK